MAHVSIDLPDQSVHIHAQRELAFEMVASLGGRGQGSGSKDAPTVLQELDDRMLVEFNTPLKLGPFRTSWRSVEWVTPTTPSSIDFELVPSPGVVADGLRQLTGRFDFAEQGNCTLLTYKSGFGIRWSIAGWLVGKVVFAPIIKRHMIEHLGELKETIESRARRSRVYPQKDCLVEDTG